MGSRLVLTHPVVADIERESESPRAPTGTIPAPLRFVPLDSPVHRWWVPALTGELRAPVPRVSALKTDAAVRRHRTEDDSVDPLIIPSEWGVF